MLSADKTFSPKKMRSLKLLLTMELSKYPFVRFASLFGSQVKGKGKEKSDVDVAVFLQVPLSDPLQTKLDIIEALEKVSQKEMDITILNEAGSVLKYQVAKNGELIFERQKGEYKKFVLGAWKEYFDFQPTLEFFYRKKIA